MLRHNKIDRVCMAFMALALVLALGCVSLARRGVISPRSTGAAYENRLFDRSTVHEINVQMADWDGFIAACENEEYALCTVTVDGETFKNVAIRAKGNTSLSRVSAYQNNRYSFKVEFDHYDDAITYHGLDKLSLNNLIQDKTLMKDYLAYTLMGKMGVMSPLCSYVKLCVNGEYYGLYLAVEGVEDAFLARNGSAGGELYKPDSTSFGGGRGNGRDFDMDAFREENAGAQADDGSAAVQDGAQQKQRQKGMQMGAMPQGGGPQGRGGMGGMGASDVKLQYTDDEIASYPNIFSNAKTDLTLADQQRLIASLKLLQQGDEAAVNREQVLRYFAVHNFLCNDDSYTGQMIHNYYLYEEDGVLEMIPWDYNLAFGAFSMGSGSAQSVVNAPIDYELSDRPMVSWIFDDEESLADYHKVYRAFAENCLANGWLNEEIRRVGSMLLPYAQEDPTAFFTAEEVTAAQEMLTAFVTARTESILGQLAGSIPATESAQRTDASALVDAGSIDLNAMGEFGMDRGGQDGGRDFMFPGGMEMPEGMTAPEGFDPSQMGVPPGGMEMPEGMTAPGGFDPSQMGVPPGGMEMPEGMEMPGGFDPSQMGVPPGGMEMPEGMTAPGGFDPSQMGVPPGGAPM
ncbi:MAG: spore coat protein CotH [Clostridiales bacterium]|nr:spore coat protein CotH [Clostridiales bacterium]